MAEFIPILNSFNAGEFSPRMKARTDLEKYESAAETIENFIIQREGGLIRRPGTKYVGELADMTKKSVLIPFIFSTDDAYAIEFSDLTIRMYTNEAIVDSGGPVVVVSPYTEAQLPDLRFSQSGDFLYIAHQAHHPAILKRTSAFVWTLSSVPFEGGPWQERNRDADWKIKHSAATGTATITANQDTFTAFDDDDEGRMLFMARNFDTAPVGADAWGWGICTTFTSATVCTFEIDPDHKFPGSLATFYNNWRLGAFSADPAIGYPASVGLFQGRLCWAGTVAQPDTFWGSETSAFDSHRPSAVKNQEIIDSHSLNYTLAAGSMNTITWMFPLRALILATPGSIHSIGGSGSDTGLSPSSVLARVITGIGTKPVIPVVVDSTLCYVTKFGNEMVGIRDDVDGLVTSNLTLLSEHILKSTVMQLSHAPSPWSLVYAVRTDGVLATMTLIPDQNVFGWSRQILGGSFSSGDAVVESACTIPSPNEDHDQTWLVVKRTIDGGTKRYVEFFEDAFDDDTDITDAYFVDCGITYDSTSTSTISGLDHLEGEAVDVLSDGAMHPTKTVSSGSITLDAAASTVQVGLAYSSNLLTLNLNAETALGTMQGKQSKIVSASIRFNNTVGGKMGRDASNLDPLPDRPSDTVLASAVQPFSKDVQMSFSGDYSVLPVVYIRQDQPLPMTILGVMPKAAVGNRA